MRKRKELRIVKELVVSRENPNIVLGNDPMKFPALADSCKAAVKSWETGRTYRVAK